MSTDLARRPGAAWLVRSVLAVVRHPSLWAVAVRQALVLAPSGWWRRAPFLPVPDAAYLRFRMITMYGSEATPDPVDVVPYLRWCRAWPHLAA